MLEAAESAKLNGSEEHECKGCIDYKQIRIRQFIAERRLLQADQSLSSESKASKRRELCKAIQKLVRQRLQEQKHEKISKVLMEFRGLKRIAAIKGMDKLKPIMTMLDAQGSPIREKQALADVFATFYEDLYACRERDATFELGNTPTATERPFEDSELQEALEALKRDRAKDESGIIAEMLKDGSRSLLETILEIFNDVLLFNADVPNAWRKSKIVVIIKKGDPKLPANYRPIAILPILYKLFSRMLCDRLTPHIMKHQSADQAAYWKHFSTEDHLLSVSLLIEKSKEYNFPVWLALVDFEKAFDSVEHPSLWEVLDKQSIPAHYIHIVKHLYSKQTASVQAGVRSREFPIKRGVKQGDPISALLFIAVMQDLLGSLQVKWEALNSRRKGHRFGIPVRSDADLTNLRFADDVILAAQSREDITQILSQLAQTSS
jgi:hypothetical protein